MPSSVESLIERVMGELHRLVQTKTVIGEPVQVGDVTLIPVSKLSFGFGAGGGQEGKGQSGTGGGAMVVPVAFVVINAEGKVQIMSLKGKELSLGQLLELMPEALGKLKKFVSKKRREDPSGEENGHPGEAGPA